MFNSGLSVFLLLKNYYYCLLSLYFFPVNGFKPFLNKSFSQQLKPLCSSTKLPCVFGLLVRPHTFMHLQRLLVLKKPCCFFSDSEHTQLVNSSHILSSLYFHETNIKCQSVLEVIH